MEGMREWRARSCCWCARDAALRLSPFVAGVAAVDDAGAAATLPLEAAAAVREAELAEAARPRAAGAPRRAAVDDETAAAAAGVADAPCVFAPSPAACARAHRGFHTGSAAMVAP